MRKYLPPINIKIKFSKCVVTLPTHDARVTTDEGVELYLKKRTESAYQPMAQIPTGTLNKYMHERPVIISAEWPE